MKRNILAAILLLSTFFVHAQNGLESVIVEKYYISDANDTIANAVGGVLPINSVTYRIFADMLPGYKFQAGYGVPGHELRFETSTLFFNNEDRGDIVPSYSKANAAHNTVMLDSWLSVGAGCDGNFGIMKSLDDGVATVVNNYTPQVLQNANSMAGIPLTTQDGLINTGYDPELVTFFGIMPTSVFNDQNDGTNGPVFSTTNGSWAALNGTYGPDTIDNKVLIAQITTNGVFSFKLNIQIGTPNHHTQNYVAENPVAAEIMLPCMIYNSTVAVQALASLPIANFKVYPNPASNHVTMEIHNAKEVKNSFYCVYDEKGSMMMNKKLSAMNDSYTENIDISSFPSGNYFIELVTDGKSSARKIIKN